MTRNVFWLGVVSFFGDVASDMVIPLLPAFLVSLGGGAEAIGVIEGAAEATASVFKYLSGRWADRFRRLLPLAASGYGLSAVVRPILALASAPWQVFAIRCADRVGKGVRTSPRDKLLASSAPPERLAEAYSFHRGMDHLGGAVGPLVASGLLLLWPGRVRLVFAIAAIPGALALAALVPVRDLTGARASGGDTVRKAARPPWRVLVPVLLFTLGNSTDALLLLRAQELGVATALVPVLWALLQVVRAGSSWPLGRLADRLGRKYSLAAGWLLYASCYAGLARASASWHAWALFTGYGLVAGLTEGSERALVASSVPEESRGSVLGVYNLVSGMGLLAASLLAGFLWDEISPAAALFTGALFAALAAGTLLHMPPPSGPARPAADPSGSPGLRARYGGNP
ncbi:MAG: MFS transporter [Myxococcales bacterium]